MTFQEWIDRESDKYLKKNPRASNQEVSDYIHDLFEDSFPGDSLDKHEPHDTTSYTDFYNQWQKDHPQTQTSSQVTKDTGGYKEDQCPQTAEELKEKESIAYKCVSPIIGELQKRLGYHPILKEVLQQGTVKRRYSNLQENYVDNKYGPRTELAIGATIRLLLQRDKENPGEQLTLKDYSDLYNYTEQNELSKAQISMDQVEAAVQSFQRLASAGGKLAVAESVSYRKDLLKPVKNRHKELEKLVFERLVKGCK